MKRLKRSTLFAIREFITLHVPSAKKQEVETLLQLAVGDLERYANGFAGHTCIRTFCKSEENRDFDRYITYPLFATNEVYWLSFNPIQDFEDIDA